MRRCFAPLAALSAVAASLFGVALLAATLVAATPAVAAEPAERLPGTASPWVRPCTSARPRP